MNRDHLPPTPDDPLLQRYHEANELDTARPSAALRDHVLAHARATAAARLDTPPTLPRTAANDSVWTWRAFGGLAVIGLVGLLVLQFDRGTPEEKELALGTGSTRLPSADVVASGPPPARDDIAPAAPVPSEEPAKPAAQTPAPPETLAAVPTPAPAAPRRREATTPIAAPQVADRMAAAESPSEPAAAATAAPTDVTAPAPGAKAVAPEAPAPMPRAAPAAAAQAPAATEGMLRERRDITAARPVSPLFAAIASGDADAVAQRLAEGADPNGRDASGRTPLIAAARSGQAAVVRALLTAGADRTLRDRDGLSAADHAERNGHMPLLPLLR